MQLFFSFICVSFSFQTCHRHLMSQIFCTTRLAVFPSVVSGSCGALLTCTSFSSCPSLVLGDPLQSAGCALVTNYSTFPTFGFVSPAACWLRPALLQPLLWQCSAGTPPGLHLLHPLTSPCSHDLITLSDLLCLFVPLPKIIDSYWLKKRRN